MTGGCLGDVAAALVDGELDDAARERAHRHLAHCAACRAEVDGQRRLKARLAGVDEPDLPSALAERLLQLAVPVEPAAQEARAACRPPSRPAPRAGATPAGRHPGSARRAGARRRRPAPRRVTTGTAVALLGLAAALVLGAPPPRPTTTPVDPGTDAFVTEFASTTAGGSSSVVLPAPSARTAGLTTFAPPTRSALLSTGGARTTR